ncbi:sulfotransferase domain-containing protein [Sphingorhabdus sp.]|uniref:sulfotransferase domain-containing protein n=1 Tax=Sphingorhabdus sp. TaxID=1902408 RepID=UPI003342D56F
MKIVIVSSPRSGNSWLRRLLVDGLGLNDTAVHNYLDVAQVPEQCALQVHWYREPNFQNFLAVHNFSVITLARHPLDVLLSVLHFVKYEPETKRWLEGNCALPDNLNISSPCSQCFIDYATSFGCENLLSVSYQWWHDKDALKIRYEDLVSATNSELERVADFLKVDSQLIKSALPLNSIENFQALPNRHGWQGRPGIWRELIPTDIAQKIFSRHSGVFQALGYDIEPSSLTHEEAERRWLELAR